MNLVMLHYPGGLACKNARHSSKKLVAVFGEGPLATCIEAKHAQEIKGDWILASFATLSPRGRLTSSVQ